MILILLQIAVFAAVAGFFVRWRAAVRRRNAQSWDSLLAQLRQDWSARELSDQFLWKEGLNATQDDAWQRMEGPKGLWVMFQNAKVMMEMADFAAKNGAAFSSTPSGVSSTSRRVPGSQCLLCRIALGRMTCPLVDTVVVSISSAAMSGL